MLIQFSVGNFLSFKERVTLSLVASPHSELKESNLINCRSDMSLTKGAVIYGANASGKSNLLKSLLVMKRFVRHSVEHSQENGVSWVRRFRLSEDTEGAPSLFEVVICLDSTFYRYGFEVTKARVINEWLFMQEKRKEEQLFLRTDCRKIDIDRKRFKEGHGLIEKTKDNALFLTVAAQFNGSISNQILDWFLSKLFVINAIENTDYGVYTKRQALEDPKFRALAGRLLRSADFGINSIGVSRDESAMSFNLTENIPGPFVKRLEDELGIRISTSHSKYDAGNKVVGGVDFDLGRDESEGTRRFFCLLGPVVNALGTGGVLAIDEIDSSLHSKLVWRIVGLFNSSETNANGAQLIFTTHDTTLLSRNLFRRDQMWFTQRDRYGVSALYSLSDYDEPIRKDASFEKDYLKGRYGGVPNITSELDEIVSAVAEKAR